MCVHACMCVYLIAKVIFIPYEKMKLEFLEIKKKIFGNDYSLRLKRKMELEEKASQTHHLPKQLTELLES